MTLLLGSEETNQMFNHIRAKRARVLLDREFDSCLSDLIDHEVVQKMKDFTQHGEISCLRHCLFVSYISFRICKLLKLDYRSAARGALLHDLFLYDWHLTRPPEGLHAFVHPTIALRNASTYFTLNDKEKDIIYNHMWPVTFRLPRYRESFIVLMADKYCAVMECVEVGSRRLLQRLKLRYAC